MGVEHYVVCRQCKEYIDLHKAYSFSMVVSKERPPVGVDCEESDFNDVDLNGGYWESRGLWFLYHHRGHSSVEMRCDAEDSWWDLAPLLKEVFPYREDEKIRERVRATKS